MIKKLKLAILFAVTLLLLPFTISSVFAAYDDIKDGTYNITAEAKQSGTNEPSAAAKFMSDKATLIVKNGQFELTLFVPNNDMMNFKKLEVAGSQPTVKAGSLDGKSGNFYTYKLSSIQPVLSAVTTYEVPAADLVHEDIGLDFHLKGLDSLPKKEEEPKEEPKEEEEPKPEEPTPAPEERVVGKLITESEADAVYELNYDSESTATKRQILNPVKLLEKGNKKYIQMPISESGAQYFRSLKVNGQEVTWNSITEGPYTIQFELPGSIEDTLSIDMVIQAGPRVMPHNDIAIWFDKDSMKTIKEPKSEETPSGKEDKKDDKKSDDDKKVDEIAEIQYQILHKNKKDKSIADQYFLKPAYLITKDGKTYVQLTIKNAQMVKDLSNKYGNAVIVKEYKDSEGILHRIVQLQVDSDLSDVLLNMFIDVPGLYSEAHEAYLVFDKASKRVLDEEEAEELGISLVDPNSGKKLSDGNNSDDNKKDNAEKSPNKPEFGEGAKDGNNKNPKTGDSTNIWLYASLALASLIPLGIQLRRRFVRS